MEGKISGKWVWSWLSQEASKVDHYIHMAAVLAHQMRLEDRLSPSQIPLFPLFAAPPWCAIKLLRGLAACLSHLHHQGWRLLLMVGVLLGSQLRRIRSSFLKPFAIHLRFL